MEELQENQIRQKMERNGRINDGGGGKGHYRKDAEAINMVLTS
jgi:hypothetical protein